MRHLTEKEVIIIGGGVAGIGTALKLANQGYKVKILEKNTLMSGSSSRNPGRMGHGFHYFDEHTAIQYLRASIQVQKAFPGFLIGDDLPFSDPIRHGRYYITKTSLHSFEEVLKIYSVIQREYARLVALNPKNKVFGEPETFLKILRPADYDKVVNPNIVAGAVETCEHLFNWPKFSLHIKALLTAHPNITLLEQTEVLAIQPRANLDARFTLDASTTTKGLDGRPLVKKVQFNTDFIVNASWENIEYLNSTAGISYLDGSRTNRLKCLLIVQLPEELTTPQMNSAFFCMGSFCMFSNMGDGRGMMTLADVTNMRVSSGLKIDKQMEYYLSEQVSKEEIAKIGHEILTGVAEYIPLMAKAKILDVKFGIVQTKGNLSLEDIKSSKSSTHHKRNYYSVRAEQQGLISNPAMKLFYFLHNSELVYQIFKNQQIVESYLNNFYNYLFKQFLYPVDLETKKAIMRHVDSVLGGETTEELGSEFALRMRGIANQILQKQKLAFDIRYIVPKVKKEWPVIKRGILAYNADLLRGDESEGIRSLIQPDFGDYLRYRDRIHRKKEILLLQSYQRVLAQFRDLDVDFKIEMMQKCIDSFLDSDDFDRILMQDPHSPLTTELVRIKNNLLFSTAKILVESRLLSCALRFSFLAASSRNVSESVPQLGFVPKPEPCEEKSPIVEPHAYAQPRIVKITTLKKAPVYTLFSPIEHPTGVISGHSSESDMGRSEHRMKTMTVPSAASEIESGVIIRKKRLSPVMESMVRSQSVASFFTSDRTAEHYIPVYQCAVVSKKPRCHSAFGYEPGILGEGSFFAISSFSTMPRSQSSCSENIFVSPATYFNRSMFI